MNDLRDVPPHHHYGTHGRSGDDPIRFDDIAPVPAALGNILVAQNDGGQLKYQNYTAGAAGTVFVGNGVAALPSYSANLFLSGHGRMGGTTALTGATTNGDWAVVRIFVGDVNFVDAIVSSNPRRTFDANDYLEYNRSSNYFTFVSGSTERARLDANGQLQLPAQGSNGGVLIGADALLYRGAADLLQTPDSLKVDGGLEVDGVANFDGNVDMDAALDVAGAVTMQSTLIVTGDTTVGVLNVDSTFDHDGTGFGVFATAPVTQQSVAALTNNVTSGGSANIIANYTDLVTYANDAATIRNNFYRMAEKVQQIRAALAAYGFVV